LLRHSSKRPYTPCQFRNRWNGKQQLYPKASLFECLPPAEPPWLPRVTQRLRSLVVGERDHGRTRRFKDGRAWELAKNGTINLKTTLS